MFINLIKENAEIDVSNLDQDILNQFTQGPEFESNKEVEDQLVIKAEEALAAAQMLELQHLQQDDSDSKGIKAIRRQIAKLEVAKQVERQRAKQGKLDDWFKKVKIASIFIYLYFCDDYIYQSCGYCTQNRTPSHFFLHKHILVISISGPGPMICL